MVANVAIARKRQGLRMVRNCISRPAGAAGAGARPGSPRCYHERVLGLGVPELLFILILALLIFGPKRLPEVGRTLGRGLSEFRRASNELKRSIESEIAEEEHREQPRVAVRPAAGTMAVGQSEPVTAPTAAVDAGGDPRHPIAATAGESPGPPAGPLEPR